MNKVVVVVRAAVGADPAAAAAYDGDCMLPPSESKTNII